MNFRIADTFTDSLARLTGEEQKYVKTTAFDLQLNPINPGMSFHKLDRARDTHFWSVRVGSDIRLIVHKTADSLLLCYVDHHDKAYHWAERRKLETHPQTGAAQLVELRETVREIVVARHVEVAVAAKPKRLLFANLPDAELLGFGVPPEWLAEVKLADEDALLALAGHLPAEAAEALLELAVGGKPQPRAALTDSDPFAHPDAQRRFRVMSNVEELQRALEFPWDRWIVFLHPAQRQGVEQNYSGPARVSGSAGTGKTIVALHRAVYLARSNPEARVLLTTFSDILANALRSKLKRLISNEPKLGDRLEVHALDAVGTRLYESHVGKARLAAPEQIRELLSGAMAEVPGLTMSLPFVLSEWSEVVDAWNLNSWDAYRDVRRLGRKRRLAEAQRTALWSVFERVQAALAAQGLTTRAGMFARLGPELAKRKHPAFDFAVVDEAQDVSVAQLKFLGALGGSRANALFFAGDLGQRIFQQPYSWRSLGVDIRGRARNLQINYRTSHQIRMHADRLLGPEVSDVDGNTEDRRGTVSVFNGPAPEVRGYTDAKTECDAVSEWLQARTREGLSAQEIGVFVRSEAELERARGAVTQSGLPFQVLDERMESSGKLSISTMHLAKGLEFRAVVVMACDDEVVPLQARISALTDEAELEEVYSTERHLLYVACTRARDQLLVSGVQPVSEFLDDMRGV